jgi:biopolymer transport protein TolQ
MNIFAGNSLWQLVYQSDAVSKCVLLILFIMSVICWAIFIGKSAILLLKQRQFKKINTQLHKAKTISDLADITTTAHATAPGFFITKTLSFLKELCGDATDKKLNTHEWELVERNIDSTIETLLIHNEEYLSLLSSSAAVAPLLGLFGTVWGLIHSFMRISETQIADIATIAPGIAEALITTIAGLIVAIPALVMFNFLHAQARTLEHSIITFAERMTFILQQLR